MHVHELKFNAVGNTMFAACDKCGVSAKVKMNGSMTERKGMVYRHHEARAKLYAHLMASVCVQQPIPSAFPLVV